MAEKTEIAWTDATFNPWWGCQKVSPGCDNCYAERDAKRFYPERVLWGPDSERRTMSDKYWRAPLLWNEKAQSAGKRLRVFTASMADVFDKDAPGDGRARLFSLIRATPNLDWLVLTKRAGNILRMLPHDWNDESDGNGYPNVWLGISVVNQAEADRDIEKLLDVPAHIHFLSIEPMLGPVNIMPWLPNAHDEATERFLDWVIVGGESGHQSRPMDAEWALSLRQQCRHTGTAYFFKQGSQANWPMFRDFSTFPEKLQVREWPR